MGTVSERILGTVVVAASLVLPPRQLEALPLKDCVTHANEFAQIEFDLFRQFPCAVHSLWR